MTSELKVVTLPPTARRSPDVALEACKGVYPETVLILGYDDEGTLVAHASIESKAEIVYLLERFKHDLLDGDYD